MASEGERFAQSLENLLGVPAATLPEPRAEAIAYRWDNITGLKGLEAYGRVYNEPLVRAFMFSKVTGDD